MVRYTDERITREEFQARKAAGKLPWGQLPVITYNGTVIGQSLAQSRYSIWTTLYSIYVDKPCNMYISVFPNTQINNECFLKNTNKSKCDIIIQKQFQ